MKRFFSLSQRRHWVCDGSQHSGLFLPKMSKLSRPCCSLSWVLITNTHLTEAASLLYVSSFTLQNVTVPASYFILLFLCLFNFFFNCYNYCIFSNRIKHPGGSWIIDNCSVATSSLSPIILTGKKLFFSGLNIKQTSKHPKFQLMCLFVLSE